MAVRVRVGDSGGFAALIASKLVDKVGEDEGLRAQLRGRLQAKYEAHAHNALVQVGIVLNEGLPGIAATAYTISVNDPDGKTVRITTPHFDALSADYAKRKPQSVAMWRKREPRGLSRFYSRAGKKVTVDVHDLPYMRSHHKGKARLGFAINLADTFKPVIRQLIMEPFVAGNEDDAFAIVEDFKAYGLGRKSISLLGYPEAGPYKRPFVAQLSAALGRRALTALRRL